jgi:NAD(P)H dehydrogenase (quinone)
VAWDTGRIYETGLLRGKQAMLITTAGAPAEFFKREGRHRAAVNDILHPIHHTTLGFCGLNVHEPFVALNVLGSAPQMLDKALEDLKFRVENLATSPNWLINWG